MGAGPLSAGGLPLPGEWEAGAQSLRDRKTKIVGTIGPTSNSREALFALCDGGLNVARLNFSHGDHASHRQVVELLREYNASRRRTVAVLLDTKGPEVRSGDLEAPLDLSGGESLTFTIEEGARGRQGRVSVNYDGFVDDVEVGDVLLVDGGIMSFRVVSKDVSDVDVEVVDGGRLESRRHLNVRGRSASLPSITDKDWKDIEFGVEEGVDFFALSFVNDADVVRELKKYLVSKGCEARVLVKIESASAVQNLDEILTEADGAMVARGDLGAELPVEEVPLLQNRIIQGCRMLGKPVIVATNMLESMIQHPTPTRAEVSDIAVAVREGTDAVMLSGETAYGRYPGKAVNMMAHVAQRTEAAMRKAEGARRSGSQEARPIDWIVDALGPDQSGPEARLYAGMVPPDQSSGTLAVPSDLVSSSRMSEILAYHTTTMSNAAGAAIVVFTRYGNMPRLLSHYRPNRVVFAFTDSEPVRRRLSLLYGVQPVLMPFSSTSEETFDRALRFLLEESCVQQGEAVAFVQSGRRAIWRNEGTHTISVRSADPIQGAR